MLLKSRQTLKYPWSAVSHWVMCPIGWDSTSTFTCTSAFAICEPSLSTATFVDAHYSLFWWSQHQGVCSQLPNKKWCSRLQNFDIDCNRSVAFLGGQFRTLWQMPNCSGTTSCRPNGLGCLILSGLFCMATFTKLPELKIVAYLPYRLVYKTHFFAPKLNIKRGGASYTWVWIYCIFNEPWYQKIRPNCGVCLIHECVIYSTVLRFLQLRRVWTQLDLITQW